MQTTTTNTSTTPQYTLKEAVVEAVNQLKANTEFSAHDVTVAVREAVNEGEYALPGYENPNVSSNIKFLVENDAVKGALQILQNDGTLANLGLTDVNYNGPYRKFIFGSPASITDDSAPDTAVPAATANAVSTDTDEDVADANSPVAQRIATYLANHGGSATIRQIHSSLKINGLTSKDLVALVDDLGYDVKPGTEGAFSTYFVE